MSFEARHQVSSQAEGEILATSPNPRASSGVGEAVDIPEIGAARFYLDVTAKGGDTPTLDVSIEEQVGNVWYTLASFAQVTDVGQKTVTVNGPCGRKLRVAWTIGGTATPNFTFSVRGILEFRR